MRDLSKYAIKNSELHQAGNAKRFIREDSIQKYRKSQIYSLSKVEGQFQELSKNFYDNDSQRLKFVRDFFLGISARKLRNSPAI